MRSTSQLHVVERKKAPVWAPNCWGAVDDENKKAQLGESWALPGDLCIVERLPGLKLVQMAGADLRLSRL
jgi:hypothetical protein